MFTVEELRKLDTSKLREELKQAEKELFKIRFEVTSGQSKASHTVREKKRYVAQMKTIMSEPNQKD
jgi:ribosomal protein L29